MSKNWIKFARIQQSPSRIKYLLKQPKSKLEMYLEAYKGAKHDSTDSKAG